MTQPDERTPEEQFGTEVRRAREVKGWTQDRLRQELMGHSGIDLSSTAMTRLEQGKRPIRFNEVTALCSVLGLSLAGYAGRPTLLNNEAFQAARKEAEQIQGIERELREKLAELRETRDAEVAEIETSIRSWRDQRLALEAAILAYAREEYERHRDDARDEIRRQIDSGER